MPAGRRIRLTLWADRPGEAVELGQLAFLPHLDLRLDALVAWAED